MSDALQRLREKREAEAREGQKREGAESWFNTISQAIGEGSTFGLADEGAAFLRHLGSNVLEIDSTAYGMTEGGMPWTDEFWQARDQFEQAKGNRSYADLLADQRNYQLRGQEEHPGAYMGLSVASGVLSGGAAGLAATGAKTAGKGVLTEAANAMRETGRFRKALTPVGVGAAEGGVAGVATENENRMMGGIYGAGLGAATGGIFGLGGMGYDVGRGVGRSVKRWASGPQDKADEIVGARLNENFGTPERVMEAAEEISPHAIMGDLDPTAAIGGARASTQGRQILQDVVEPRQAEQVDRIGGILREEITDPVAYDSAQQATRKSQQEAANAMYGDIQSARVPPGAVDPILDTVPKSVIRSAEEEITMRGGTIQHMKPALDDAGEPIINPKTGEMSMVPGDYTLGFLDQVRRELRNHMDRTGSTAAEVPMNRLSQTLDPMVEGYGPARQAFSTQSAIMDAGEMGKKLGGTKDPRIARETRGALEELPQRAGRGEGAELTPEEVLRSREGVSRGLLDTATPRGEKGNAAARILNPEQKATMGEYGGENIIPRIEGERRMGELATMLDPNANSATAGRLGASEALESEAVGMAADIANVAVNPSMAMAGATAINNAVGALISDGKITPEVGKRIAQIMARKPSVEEAARLMEKAAVPEIAQEAVLRHLTALTPVTGAAVGGGRGVLTQE